MSTASRVVPATSLTSMRSSRRMRLTSDDFPTFGRPTIAMRGSGSSAFCSSDFAVGQPLDHFVEEIADAHARARRRSP